MKSKIAISADKQSVKPAEAAALYVEMGWGTPARYSAARMKRSLAQCDIVVSARNDAGELIGLARALSDFALDTKILDMVVVPEYQRQGVGRAMMKAVAARAGGTALYGETERKNFRFMESCGFKRRNGLAVFVKKSIK